MGLRFRDSYTNKAKYFLIGMDMENKIREPTISAENALRQAWMTVCDYHDNIARSLDELWQGLCRRPPRTCRSYGTSCGARLSYCRYEWPGIYFDMKLK